MGIPLFAKTITRKYPSIIDSKSPICSRLFLDLNCAIHQCTNNILAMNQSILPETLEHDIVEHTINYILKIANYAEPKEVLMIAIDGIPPRAKILQQRKRRFVSSWRQNLIDIKRKETNTVYTDWDRNAITPGTTFMEFLSKSLHKYFDDKKKFPYEVILSDSNEEGEGEAKILDYIKDNPVPENTDIIYGLDADLIMLSLLSSRNNVFLLREPAFYDMKTSTPFLFFNIPLLRRYISVECGIDDVSDERAKLEDDAFDENVVWDYVALCFLQGNDFLPSLSFLKIRYNGIDMTVQAYKKIKKELEQPLIVKNKKYEVNYLFLLKLLESLKSQEDGCFCEAEENYYAKTSIPFVGKKSPLERVMFEIDNYPTLNKFPRVIQPEKPGWRLRYYHYLFNQITDIHEVNEVCLNYLEAIQWTTDYYFNRCISRHWYYKYNYSPTILDLYNFLLINLENTEDFIKENIKSNYPQVTYDTDLQLLMCLPPSSRNLLKPKIRPIMDDITLGCVHLYPQKFMITGYLKSYLWEAYPCLPLVDVERLDKMKKNLLGTQ
jgi:5'-3' exoribonuclease 1